MIFLQLRNKSPPKKFIFTLNQEPELNVGPITLVHHAYFSFTLKINKGRDSECQMPFAFVIVCDFM